MFSGLALALAATVADPAALAPPPETLREARALAARLADPSFREREAASVALARLGRFALPALAESLASPAAEVRGRAGVLFPPAAEAERAARLASFLADGPMRYPHDVPGWKAFAQAAGETPDAKALYADAASEPDNARLFKELDGGTSTPALLAALSTRREELQQVNSRARVGLNRAEPLALPDVAAVVAAEVLTGTEAPPPPTREYLTAVFLNSPAGRQALVGEGDHGVAMAQLTRRWIATRASAIGLAQAVAAANNVVNSEARSSDPTQQKRFPVSVLTDVAGRHFARVDLPIAARLNAWMALVRHRATDQLAQLAAPLADQADLIRPAPNSNNPRVMARDLALVAALIYTNQKPADYGFTDRNSLGQLTYQTYTFRDDPAGPKGISVKAETKRQKAFAQWATWRAATRGGLGGALLAGSPDTLVPPVVESAD